MGSYFNDVYLKRMNKDGETMQERIKTKKENKFDKVYLKRTESQGTLYQINDEEVKILCSVEPSKWTQDKIVSNINISSREKELKTGDILKVYQKVKDIEYDKTWLICYVSNDISHGYQSYEAIELDSVINLADEYGQTYAILPVKFVSETSVFVKDKFMSYGSVTYREGLMHRKFITADSEILKKATYFNYANRGWEIAEKDDISIKNVAYVSIEEFLRREPEPETSKDILVGEDQNFLLNHLKR